MTDYSIDETDGTSDRPSPNRPLSTAALLSGASRRIRATPSTIFALLVAGLIVAAVDRVVLRGPIPTVGYRGIQDGQVSVAFGIVVNVLSGATVPPSALVGLKPAWFAWVVGLEGVGFVAVTAASAYAIARLLNVPLTSGGVLRYAAVGAAFQSGIAQVNFEGASIIVGLPLVLVAFVVLVRLFALPGLLVMGDSVSGAFRRSWILTKGYGWSLVGVIVPVGLLNHLLASAPVVGPVGSALAGVLHAGTVAVFLRRTSFLDEQPE